MVDEKKEPISTENTEELESLLDELPFKFDDTDTTNIGCPPSSSTKNHPSNAYSNVNSIRNQMPQKYHDFSYLTSVTLDQLMEEVTTDYLDLAESNGLKDIRTIAHDLLSVSNKAIAAMAKAIKSKGIKTTQHLTAPQIGECLIRIHNVINFSLDDSGDQSERSTMLAVYVEHGEDEGIYHFDDSNTSIKRLINMYYYLAKTNDQNEVLNYLRIHAPLQKRCSDPNLIAVKNGIFDFDKKILMPFTPERVFRTKLKVAYNPSAVNVVIHNDDGSDWDVDSWIREISDDSEIEEVLWQVISASIRPNVPFNKAVFFYSRCGNNGKGTLLQLIRNIWGEENCCTLSVEEFDKDFMLMPLLSKSIVLGDENPVGLNLEKAAKFKQCVTHDPVLVNMKHKEAKSYVFKGLIIECLNEILRFKDKTGSLIRRELIIPFSKSFTGAERKYIKTDYIARPEVLEYVLYRALNLNVYEFSEPQACLEALIDQREMNDPIRQFWNEVNAQFVWDLLPTEFLYELYKAWIRKNIPNCHVKGKHNFIDELADIAKEGSEWQYTGRNQMRVSKNMANTPEPLIVAYNLEDWKNPKYTGTDINRICMPAFKEKYTGLVRL